MLRKILALIPLTLLTSAALAGGNGWEWEEEFSSRHWRDASLQWAQDLHPNHPSFSTLLAQVNPPSHEMWCHYTGEPTLQDKQIHKDLLEDWLHYFLGIPPNNPLPLDLPPYPEEC